MTSEATSLLRAAQTGPAPVVIGLTAYNGAAHVAETLQSLLRQTCGDFRLVVLDDASEDATVEIVLREIGDDPRVSVWRHAERQGMVATWREAFELCVSEVPQARWFAWAADHDLLDKDWLRRLLAHAEANPQAAAIYPSIRNISAKGEINPKAPAGYENRNPDPIRRFDQLQTTGGGFGNIIYGLFRIDALRQAGVFRRVLAPDRLAVLEVSLLGELHQVERAIRLRRRTGVYSIERQKRSLFGPSGPPAYAGLYFFIPHAALILKHHLRRGGLAWKARLTGAVLHMLADQTQRQTIGRWRKDRARAAAQAAKVAKSAGA